MDVSEFVRNATILVIGAFILFVLVQSFSEVFPGFGQYGWALLGAFIVGAALFLKYALRR